MCHCMHSFLSLLFVYKNFHFPTSLTTIQGRKWTIQCVHTRARNERKSAGAIDSVSENAAKVQTRLFGCPCESAVTAQSVPLRITTCCWVARQTMWHSTKRMKVLGRKFMLIRFWIAGKIWQWKIWFSSGLSGCGWPRHACYDFLLRRKDPAIEVLYMYTQWILCPWQCRSANYSAGSGLSLNCKLFVICWHGYNATLINWMYNKLRPEAEFAWDCLIYW